MYTLGCLYKTQTLHYLRRHPTDPDRFDYNDERVTVTITKPTRGVLTIVDKFDNAPVATAHVMNENDRYAKLRNRVTLVCTPSVEGETPVAEATGTYTVKITDSTDDKDFPIDSRHPTISTITFTLYVTPVTVVGDNPAIEATRTRIPEITDKTYPVSSLYTFDPDTGDFRVRYQVI